jgi:hypothetical protein
MLPSYWPHDFDISPESDPFKYWVGNRSVLEPMKFKCSIRNTEFEGSVYLPSTCNTRSS